MPETRSADWSQIKLRCSVIVIQYPAHLRAQVDRRDIEINEDVLHWDYLGSRICDLMGRELTLRTATLPPDLARMNAEFWIAHDNTITPPDTPPTRLFFRRETDAKPAATVVTAPGEW